MNKLLIFVGIVLVCHVFGLHNTMADEDCCPHLGSFNDEKFCADGTAAAPFCGIGACDSEGCNCKGGCKSDLNFGDENDVADHQGHEDSGHEDPGHEASGHEASGHEDPGHEASGHEDPGHENPETEQPAEKK